MFNCELCGKPIEAGICEPCLKELGLEVYTVTQEKYQECWICEGNALTCDCNTKGQEPCWVCGGKGFDNLVVQCPYCN